MVRVAKLYFCRLENRGCTVVPRVVKKVKFELCSWKGKAIREKPEAVMLLVCGPIEKVSLIENPEGNFSKKKQQ